MLEKDSNMQSCKDKKPQGGKIQNAALNASWIDLMVAPCCPTKLPTTETSLVAKITKP
jgi:hypothetical protein